MGWSGWDILLQQDWQRGQEHSRSEDTSLVLCFLAPKAHLGSVQALGSPAGTCV